jgi:hypothetical protein
MRLENYSLFEEAVGSLASRDAVLAHFKAEARAHKEAAMLSYIHQQLEYVKMWKILDFSQVRLAVCGVCAVMGHAAGESTA